ncbi:Aste57867_14590 [Aphanomyces stellatus]|uniref:Aste57867_14590 protein n=1 Tax=Aphanomyces stellatus TaxID=120398 RepID=A0A485L1L4_9STRA|nr:hypothetical protein As57867_014536 [Aphanomyces stellatus]VFT91409.1 Aste57867_14590 [Aphanomyces stellatus]
MQYQESHTQPRVWSPYLCTYKSGKCGNPRAVKLNGELHSLCHSHREKQNAHQRKSDLKARRVKATQKKQYEQAVAQWRAAQCSEAGRAPLCYATTSTRHERTCIEERVTGLERTPSPTPCRLPPIQRLFQHIDFRSTSQLDAVEPSDNQGERFKVEQHSPRRFSIIMHQWP